jgi:hypothetical protein
MIKFTGSLIFLLVSVLSGVFARSGSDGSYFWNTVVVNCQLNSKYELTFINKEHYSNQVSRFDFYYLDFAGYRKVNPHLSIGLGYRKSESYKSAQWNPGNNYFLYGIYYASPGSLKLKISNRFGYKTFYQADSQYAWDNISNLDFFTKSSGKLPKPYLSQELFSELKSMKIQNYRMFGGLHLLRKDHFGIDAYYCYWKTRSVPDWKTYHVFGLSTKFHI